MASTSHGTTTLRAETRSISLEAPAGHVFDFVANPENLPRWAVGFCRAIRRGDERPDRWIATTAHGDVPIRYVTDATLGVIDFHFSPAPNVQAVACSRVVANGDGAEYVFTQFQSPGMPDAVFEAQVEALVEELQVLRGVIRARGACPA